MVHRCYLRSLQAVPMPEKRTPASPLNLPRPVRLIHNTDRQTSQGETLPRLPDINGIPLSAPETIERQENTGELVQSSQSMAYEDEGTLKLGIDVLPTKVLPSVKRLEPQMAGTRQGSIYANTAYARRLERHQRAKEKKLSWNDARQFSQFVTPFKWQIALALLLTVGIGLTALPLPFIFRTML